MHIIYIYNLLVQNWILFSDRKMISVYTCKHHSLVLEAWIFKLVIFWIYNIEYDQNQTLNCGTSVNVNTENLYPDHVDRKQTPISIWGFKRMYKAFSWAAVNTCSVQRKLQLSPPAPATETRRLFTVFLNMQSCDLWDVKSNGQITIPK